LELSAPHEPLMVAREHLPVSCIFNNRLPSLLIDQVDIITPELVLRGFIVCHDMQRAHSDLQGEDNFSPIHHEERRLARGSIG
jgi:hypothetical protein